MKRNKFSLSNTKLLSCDLGELVPINIHEVLPGDSVQQATSALVRCSPLLAPVMHPVHVTIHKWFVPLRLIWEDFEDFITGGPDGLNASVYPTITFGGGSGVASGSLADYLGVVPGVNNIEVSALPFRAYAMIFNEWYRDQDLQTELVIDETSGPDTTTSTVLQNGCWEKDYFTSARPWEQKGAAVTVPLGTSAPVKGLGIVGSMTATGSTASIRETGGGTVTYPQSVHPEQTDAEQWRMRTTGASDAARTPDVFADLSAASAVTVNVLREALALHRYEEARARFGSRYSEYLRYLGVTSSDARLQRPEYLGGGRQTIQFSEILQTAEGTNPVGELRGHGVNVTRTNRYRRYFEEHGYCITLMCVRPKTIYASGLARHFNRRVKEDFWQKELQHIGQQEVLNKEVYAAHASPDGVFGYQDRYDEYRRAESTIAGEFRDSTLNYWHFARIFGSTPALNSDFVKSVPTERTFAVPGKDVLWVMARNSVQARRLVASQGTSFIY